MPTDFDHPLKRPAPLGLAVAGALLLGVLLVQTFPVLPGWVGLAVASPAALWLLLRSSSLRLLGALVLGMLLASGHGRWVVSQQLPSALTGQDVWVTGVVSDLPVQSEDAVRFEFRVTAGEGGAAPLTGRNLRLSWYRSDVALQPGSQWRLPVKLRPPRGVLNPGGYDFERRALEQRIAATGYIRNTGTAQRLSGGAGIDAMRAGIAARIDRALPDERARFVKALAIGDTRGLTPHDWDVLRATGLTHLIAISGFHVGMIAGWFALIAGGLYRLYPSFGKWLPRPQGAALAALMAAAGYTALAGFALPTVRTLLMIVAVLLARLWRRPQRLGDALALALIAILVVDPLAVLAPGFWLSFLGVVWLMWCLPHARGASWLASFFKAQGVATLGLLPLTVWFFGQASLTSPLVNVVGIPWISLGVVPLAVLGLAADSVSTGLADALWWLAATLMQGLWWLVERIAAWPLSLVWLPEPSPWALGLALIGTFWLLLPRGVPGKLLAALLWLPLLWPAQQQMEPGEVEIVLLDVGQGLSVLVRTSSHALLYDAGAAPPNGLDFGEAAVVPALRSLGVSRLDTVLVSHGDNDHAGGVPAVLRNFPEATLIAPEGWAGIGRPMHSCRRGQRWEWDDVGFEILHPPPLLPYLRNDSSCVLRIEAAGRVALLPGDIGRHVETRLVKEQARRLAADVLIAPHHGSGSSSSGDFLDAVRPGIALFAVGADNRFGLPKADVLQRYRALGTVLHDSAGSGAIRLTLGAKGVTVRERYRFDHPRYWRPRMEVRAGQGGSGSGSGYAIDP